MTFIMMATLFIGYLVVIFLICFVVPFLVKIKTPIPIVIVFALLMFLIIPSLIAQVLRFLITRALEWGRTVFGRGKINAAIQKTTYAPGDTISGNVALTLKEPVNAVGISISLIGEETTEGGGGILSMILSGGTLSYNWKRRRIYDYKQLLDGEKEYSGGREYNFEIKMPADIPHMPKPEGEPSQVQEAANTATAIIGLKPLQETPEPEGKQNRWLEIAKETAAAAGLITLQRTKWYLLAKLDIPRGLDISKKVKVTIG